MQLLTCGQHSIEKGVYILKRTAIITGASSGIGRQMAIDLDLRGFDTVLVARREEKLKEGETYTITAGDMSEEVTLEGTITSNSTGGMGGGFGGRGRH